MIPNSDPLEQIRTCTICMEQYNSKEREPKILPQCGHSICLQCLSKILGYKDCCPQCNTKFLSRSINDYKRNYAIPLEETPLPDDYCSDHKMQLNNVCLDCKQKICQRCLTKGSHKGHSYDLYADFVQEAAIKYESYLTHNELCMNSFDKETSEKLKKLEEEAIVQVSNRFDKVIDYIESQKKREIEKVQKFIQEYCQKSIQESKEAGKIRFFSKSLSEMFEILSKIEANSNDKKQLSCEYYSIDLDNCKQRVEALEKSIENQSLKQIEDIIHVQNMLEHMNFEEVDPEDFDETENPNKSYQYVVTDEFKYIMNKLKACATFDEKWQIFRKLKKKFAFDCGDIVNFLKLLGNDQEKLIALNELKGRLVEVDNKESIYQ